jgi:hypothetical protein
LRFLTGIFQRFTMMPLSKKTVEFSSHIVSAWTDG